MELVLEDPVVYTVMGAVFGLLAAAIIVVLRSRPPPPPPPRETREQETQEKEKEQVSLEEALGLDRAVAARFYRELRKAMRSGRVRVALVSDECDGTVVYDFAREEWLCTARDGTAYRLGGRPLPEQVVVEDVEEGGG